MDKVDQLDLPIYQQLPAQVLLPLLLEVQSLLHRVPHHLEPRPELMTHIEMVMIEKGDLMEEMVEQNDFEWTTERADMLDHQAQ